MFQEKAARREKKNKVIKEPAVTVDFLFFSYFYVHFWVRIHVVKKLLIVDVLLIPLQSLVVAEVVSKGDQKHLAAVQFGLFAVLIQEQRCSAGGTDRQTDREGGREAGRGRERERKQKQKHEQGVRAGCD